MVIFTPPAYLSFGVSVTPGLQTILPFDVNSVVIPAWQNLDIIPERVSIGTMTPDIDYTWNKVSCLWTLLKPNDKFEYGENFTVQFQQLTTAQTGTDLYNTGFTQYPHTLKYKVRNQVTLVAVDTTRKCRVEQDGRALQGLNQQGANIKAIVYLSLPADEVRQGTPVEVYDGNVLKIADTVKNFSLGQLNARIWL